MSDPLSEFVELIQTYRQAPGDAAEGRCPREAVLWRWERLTAFLVRHGLPIDGLPNPDVTWRDTLEWRLRWNDPIVRFWHTTRLRLGEPLHDKRLSFNKLTWTVTLDGKPEQIQDPKAFAVYKAIADKKGGIITKAEIRGLVPGTRGQKTIRTLLDSLPRRLRSTVKTLCGRGYALQLPARK
jgi:hypothetical protein